MADELPSIIDFASNIEDTTPPAPLPAGTYIGTIKGVTTKLGKESQKLNAVVDFFISPDQYPADYTEGEPDGVTLTKYVQMEQTQKSMYALKGFLNSIGAPGGKRIDVHDWIGREARLTIQAGSYNGLAKAEIGKVEAI